MGKRESDLPECRTRLISNVEWASAWIDTVQHLVLSNSKVDHTREQGVDQDYTDKF